MPIIGSDIDAASNADGYDITSFNVHLTIKQNVYINAYQGQSALSYYGFDFVLNDGVLSGGSGVNMGGGGEDYLFNSSKGEIYGYYGVSGSTSSNEIQNDGTISGTAEGIFFQSGEMNTITNTGKINSVNAIYLYNETSSTIINSGVLSGTKNAVNASSSDNLTIINSGLVEGAINISGTDSTVYNSGKIDGDVVLGDGTNTFNGHGGTVSGTITGGTGADVIRAGDDGETMAGGAGHDRLQGGAGADTFAFSSYSSADYDHVRGFNVATDTIQLAHSAFTHLVADAVPTFSIATAPTSSTDLLYYNSSSGGLFYDPDGNGSTYHGYMVAALGPGLALTVKNFEVV